MSRTRIAIVVAALAVPASADEYVDRADGDGDGFVSLHELRAAHYADPEFNRRIEQMFEFFDSDGDGRISNAEKEQGKARLSAANRTPAPVAAPAAAAVAVPQPEPASPPASEELAPVTVSTDRRTISSSSAPPPLTAPQTARATAPAPQTNEERMLAWIADIDTDRSGGASRKELIDSGGGTPWFQDRDFAAADRDGDGDLSAEELAVLVRSQERRRH